MTTRNFEVSVRIENTPEAVIGYIADVRNRPLYLASLKVVSDIKGDPSAAGTTWKWTWVALGMEFEGIGRCLEHDPGQYYSFKTEGGIASKWSYRAEPEAEGTKLTLQVEYEIPDKVLPHLPSDSMASAMRESEADRVLQNLRMILDR